MLAAVGVGYVLGPGPAASATSRSGPARKVADNPKVQRVATGPRTPRPSRRRGRRAAKDNVTSAASTAADKVRGKDSQIGMQATP